MHDSNLTHRTFNTESSQGKESSRSYSNSNSGSLNTKELPSRKQLIRSTKISMIVAFFILILFILPAEYGLDITGIGNLLGLKEMGKIKMSLKKDIEKISNKNKENVEKLTEESVVDESVITNKSSTSGQISIQTGNLNISGSVVNNANLNAIKSDTIVVQIEPDASTELKLRMKQGQKITYNRYVDVGHLNYNMHAEGDNGEEVQYGDGRQLQTENGNITAEFDGKHGWFFRNRSEENVTLTIVVTGSYIDFKQMF